MTDVGGGAAIVALGDCAEYKVRTQLPGEMGNRVRRWEIRHRLTGPDVHVEVYEVRLVRRPSGPGRASDMVIREHLHIVTVGVFHRTTSPGVLEVRLDIDDLRDEYLIRVCP